MFLNCVFVCVKDNKDDFDVYTETISYDRCRGYADVLAYAESLGFCRNFYLYKDSVNDIAVFCFRDFRSLKK